MPTIMIGGTKTQYEKGVSYETIAKDFQHKYKNRIALVYFNRKMRELNRKVTGDGVLTFITTGESSGFKAYSRTASMMLVKALSNIMGERSRDVRLKFEFSLGNASYCTVIGDVNVDDQLADQLTEEMKRLRDRNIPIIKKTYPIDDAIELFRRQGMKDKEKLFQYRRSSTINVYNMDGYYDYFYGYMLPSTGYVELFRVQAYEGGLLLVLPTQDNPNELEEWHEQKSLFDQLIMGTRWGDLVDISTVGDLNEQICAGNISDMILVQEALQERRIGDIAEMIHERSSVKIVMVAGPSSSGKTTFAHRLAIQLRSFGMKPHIFSMDNSFVNREKTPLDADGNYNFECLEALDLELFEDDMCDLLEGEEIEMPTFDFRSGRRVYKGNTMQLGPQDVLIIEGIHGLNPRTTQELPQEAIFKVYISALTSLNVDEHNRIGSTDVRLIRRMIRDARTRGNSAKATIGMWKKVRDGEEEYIFPYQSNADVVFNSVLIYELSILKHFAEPLLFNIRQNEPEYYEAKRLLKFLDYFVGVDTEAVPKNSLCREFVGGGCFPL